MSTNTIVITRPSGQARQLSEALTNAFTQSGLGKEAAPRLITLPLLTIVPKEDVELAQQIAASLSEADLAIFVSPNAIECTMRLLEKSWQDCADHPILIGVMGGSSLLALKNHGIGSEPIPTSIILPKDQQQWDSEGLWNALSQLHWDWPNKKVIIFKGEGGRDWLADTLLESGAPLKTISVYARVPLDIDSPLWNEIQQLDFAQSLWLLTSSEAVRYLGKVIQDQFNPNQDNLGLATAICPHHNISDAAEQIGFGEVFTCDPGDLALIAATQAWLAVKQSALIKRDV